MQSNPETTADGRTLRDILAVTPEELAPCMNQKTLMNAAKDDDGQSAGWMAGGRSSLLSGQVAQHVCDSLNENLADMFTGAWEKYSELKKCAKETRDNPRSTMNVALADHDFTYEMDSNVDVLLNGKKVASIPLSFAATCTVSGLVLLLKQGCVYQVHSGKLDCHAEIRCAHDVVWTRQLAGVNLPGELHLARPIALDS